MIASSGLRTISILWPGSGLALLAPQGMRPAWLYRGRVVLWVRWGAA